MRGLRIYAVNQADSRILNSWLSVWTLSCRPVKLCACAIIFASLLCFYFWQIRSFTDPTYTGSIFVCSLDLASLYLPLLKPFSKAVRSVFISVFGCCNVDDRLKRINKYPFSNINALVLSGPYTTIHRSNFPL